MSAGRFGGGTAAQAACASSPARQGARGLLRLLPLEPLRKSRSSLLKLAALRGRAWGPAQLEGHAGRAAKHTRPSYLPDSAMASWLSSSSESAGTWCPGAMPVLEARAAGPVCTGSAPVCAWRVCSCCRVHVHVRAFQGLLQLCRQLVHPPYIWGRVHCVLVGALQRQQGQMALQRQLLVRGQAQAAMPEVQVRMWRRAAQAHGALQEKKCVRAESSGSVLAHVRTHMCRGAPHSTASTSTCCMTCMTSRCTHARHAVPCLGRPRTLGASTRQPLPHHRQQKQPCHPSRRRACPPRPRPGGRADADPPCPPGYTPSRHGIRWRMCWESSAPPAIVAQIMSCTYQQVHTNRYIQTVAQA